MTDVGYHIRNGWLQKPPLGVQLNWAHPLTKGLVGCWLFNEGGGDKAYDLSGYNNHGTLNNMAFPSTAASGWNPGKDGVGLTFDGSADYVGCGNDPSLNTNDVITIEAWIKPDSVTNFKRLVYYSSEIDYAFTSGAILKAGATYLTATSAFTTGEWQHIAIVEETGQDVNCYRNSVDITSGTPSSSLSALDRFVIGNRTAYDKAFNGIIDEVKIYNRALSAFEIGWLHREPYAMFEPATKYTIIDERLATDYVGGNVMAAELI